MTSLFAWLEATGIANAIAGSTIWTGSLSAAHVVGFTLVMGGALVANLQSLGVLFPQGRAIDLEPSANRIIVGGVAISLLTGVLLFSVRATELAANGTFR